MSGSLAPTDAKAVQALLSSDLQRAVSLYGEAWFLSVRHMWPACARHEEFIAAIERGALEHGRAENPFEQPAQRTVQRLYKMEVPKVALLTVDSDVLAWLQQVESICTIAGFSEVGWVDLAAAYMEEVPRDCWVAAQQQTSECDSAGAKQWSRFKDWCKSSLHAFVRACLSIY